MKNRNYADSQFWESAKRNKSEFLRYYNNFVELAVAMFEWKNLPDTVDPRFLELTLLTDGMSVFFYEEDIGYLALRTMIGGQLSVYNIPLQRNAYAANGFNRMLNEENSVLIFNNQLRTPMKPTLENYALELYEIDRTIMVNVKAQKTPVLLKCTEAQRLTLKNLYMQYDGNQPFIFADKGLDPEAITCINTGAPYVSDKLMQIKTQKFNEVLTYLGITNTAYQKKERLVADESERAHGGTIANRFSRLNARRQAADEINRMFGLNVEVDFREDYRGSDEDMIDDMDNDNVNVDITTD